MKDMGFEDVRGLFVFAYKDQMLLWRVGISLKVACYRVRGSFPRGKTKRERISFETCLEETTAAVLKAGEGEKEGVYCKVTADINNTKVDPCLWGKILQECYYNARERRRAYYSHRRLGYKTLGKAVDILAAEIADNPEAEDLLRSLQGNATITAKTGRTKGILDQLPPSQTQVPQIPMSPKGEIQISEDLTIEAEPSSLRQVIPTSPEAVKLREARRQIMLEHLKKDSAEKKAKREQEEFERLKKFGDPNA